jgi:hypothetical protein
MYSHGAMLRALVPYLIVGSVISGGAGAVYGAGGIGVPALYAALLLAGLVALVGYARWDERHHA